MTTVAAIEPVGTRESCTCAKCVACCHRRPGWMLPGEAEKIAAFLKLSLEELFEQYLIVDWWWGADEATPDLPDHDIRVLSPGMVGYPVGGMDVSRWIRGTCVFLRDGRCSIHDVKPFECREALVCSDGQIKREDSATVKVPRAWNAPEHQVQIDRLLKRHAL